MAGRRPAISYGLEDMATDVVGLLDGFSLNRAHMVGMSMGGMIAQLVAARYPDRCHSLTSIMSSSSDRSLPPPRPEAATILSSAPLSQAPADIIDFGLRVNDVIGSPGFRWDRKALRDHIANCVKRSYSPGGYLRQYAAVLSAPSRRDLLTKITLPSLVVHGTDDPLLPPACGQDVADHIRGAKMVLVPGMGHDLSPALCDHLATMILPHVRDA
jgi:pimeloyl-ACP methyl ester carboxylesterase